MFLCFFTSHFLILFTFFPLRYHSIVFVVGTTVLKCNIIILEKDQNCMILSYDVQNNLDVHSESGMCQITHRRCFVLWQSFHFQGACILLSSAFLITLIYLISKVCVCIYFWLFCHDWRRKNEEKSFCPSFLVAEGTSADRRREGDSESPVFDALVCQNGKYPQNDLF